MTVRSLVMAAAGARAAAPSLDLNFIDGSPFDPRIVFTRASGGTYFDATGTMQTAAANVPRIDYDPATHAPRGLLIEEARTNKIPNPRAEGAIPGTPGTAPTGWAPNPSTGITRQIVGSGYEDGLPYVDMRFFGTPSDGLVFACDYTGAVPAVLGNLWTGGANFRLVAGAWKGTEQPYHRLFVQDSVLINLSINQFNFTITTAALKTQRPTFTYTIVEPTAAFVLMRLGMVASRDTPVDFTLRFCGPQLELGGFPTSLILPPVGTPAASTRAGDWATMPVGAWYNPAAVTYAVEFIPNGLAGRLLVVADPTQVNWDGIYTSAATGVTFNTFSPGNLGRVDRGPVTPGGITKVAYANTSIYRMTSLGGANIAGSLGARPSGQTVMALGSDSNVSGTQIGGYIRRVRVWPRALSSGELQGVTL